MGTFTTRPIGHCNLYVHAVSSRMCEYSHDAIATVSTYILDGGLRAWDW